MGPFICGQSSGVARDSMLTFLAKESLRVWVWVAAHTLRRGEGESV